jgi:hypothetical protein
MTVFAKVAPIVGDDADAIYFKLFLPNEEEALFAIHDDLEQRNLDVGDYIIEFQDV